MMLKRSIVTLLAASVFKPAVQVLIGTAVLQTVLFLTHGMNRAVILHEAFRFSYTAGAAGVGFILISIILARSGCETSSQISLTLKRLSVSEEAVFWIQAGFNSAVYLLFWTGQIITVYLLARYYVGLQDPATVTPHTIFFAFYRSPYLHSILPLGASVRWIRNLGIIAGLGVSSAALPYVSRRGRSTVWIHVLVTLTLIFFVRRPGELTFDLIPLAASLLIGLLSIGQMKRQEVLDGR